MKRYLIILAVTSLFILNRNILSAGNNPHLSEWQIINYQNRLEKILETNIIPFWLANSIDKTYGGFILNHDIYGKQRKEPANKMIVSQARMVWFFSRLVNTRHGSEECLLAAKQGYEFLRDKMWDKNNGGFYWAVNHSGDAIINSNKHMYGQAFGLYAVIEYAKASKDEDALKWADTMFGLWEKYAHDKQHGGYVEFFLSDWSTAPENLRGEDCLNVPNSFKLMNTHLHLMEALTAYYRLAPKPLVRERLLELVRIQSNTVVRKDVGACTDKYGADWTPRLTDKYEKVSYGHDVENIWLLIEACNALDISNSPFLDLFRILFDYSIKYGFDHREGGFYRNGFFNKQADQKDKVWWAQAEGLASSLHMFAITQDHTYLVIFDKTLEWIERNQIDWENGDWFCIIDQAGNPRGDKAYEWKGAYHNGRAIMECLNILKKMDSEINMRNHNKALK